MKVKIIIGLLVAGILGAVVWAMTAEPVKPLPPEPVATTTPETMTVKVFFGNRRLDPDSLYCERVYPTVRELTKTEAVARAAILELLKGPTAAEQAEGFVTSLNSGVVLQSLTITNGVARADFSLRLGEQVGGSCLVSAIRAQIIETLKQFPTVESVIISIDGQVDDILQP